MFVIKPCHSTMLYDYYIISREDRCAIKDNIFSIKVTKEAVEQFINQQLTLLDNKPKN